MTLTGGGGETATIQVFGDFPDYVSDPITNVRPSHPYGLFLSTHNLFVVDAAMNSVRRIDLASRQIATVAAFPPLQNPTSVGPPVMDAVPDSIRLYGSRLLVPFLAGFPFPPGSSEVRSVDPATGNQQTLLPGLTSAIDVLPVSSGGADQFLVLEFSTDMRAGKPGQLLLIPLGTTPPGIPPQSVVGPPLPAATSLALDRRTSEIFVTQLANGQITRINAALLIPPVTQAAGIIPVIASTPGLGSRFQTFVELHNPYSSPISGTLVFHPLGVPGSSADATLNYTLLPYQTVDYPDLLAAFGQTGVGSLDVFTTTGSAPVIEARVFGDKGGIDAGAGEELISADEALLPGQGGTLLVPSGGATKRFNIGIRSLGSGASMTITIRDRSGSVRRSFSASYPADYFAQFSAADLLGVAPQPGDSIRFALSAGRAVVYGATVDSVTQQIEIVLGTRTTD